MSRPGGGAQTEDEAADDAPLEDGEAALRAVATRSTTAAPITGVARTVLREQVKELLIERIIRGELGPGAPLVETRIAQELGTSQAPVREALRDLALLRLVEAEPFRSARVRQFSRQDVLDIYGVRAALDDLAARRACSELAGDVVQLEAGLEEMRAAARSGDRAGLIRHDLEFHRQILDAAGNPALTQCWATLGVEAMLTLTIYRPMTDPLEVAESHIGIVEALRGNRPAAAGREARRHVELYAKLARSNRSAR